MSTLSTHVLDTSTGKPANGIGVVLHGLDAAVLPGNATDSDWSTIGEATTNSDGRVGETLAPSTLTPGSYCLTFQTATYFKASDNKCFYPYVRIIFEITEADSHYHVPLLISPFGYSTYRGS